MSGAATVGGLGTLAAGVGGAIGYGIGSIQIGNDTIHGHLGAGMYWGSVQVYNIGAATVKAGAAALDLLTNW